MTEPQEELLQLADRLRELADRAKTPEICEPVAALASAADQVGKSWSGSALGYHAYVYYADLEPPPPSAHFSPEWGLKDAFDMGTSGDWREFDPDEVEKAIYEIAGEVDLSQAREFSKQAQKEFDSGKSDMLSIFTHELSQKNDTFLHLLNNKLDELLLLSKEEVQSKLTPRGVGWSRDSLAITQGLRLPPHIKVSSEAQVIQHTAESVERLSELARKAGSHLLRRQRQRRKEELVGTNVFIGHGQSLIWRELKDFIEDRLGLVADEFNRVPVAGMTNISRLADMLDAGAIAFLVMTGEDEQRDGKLHARMNVVHEAGLFQGRLGFGRAIIVLEEGCEEFSNIHGLGQIRFPKGNIKAAFEEVRLVLEREGLIA